MADAALVATGAGAAPLSYKVPGAAVILIKQIHVAYTDNSAGADWLPLVRIVSDSNHTMGQAADQAVKVTAGDDAAVTFHPGVKHGAAPPTVIVANSFVSQARTTNQTITSGVVTALAPGLFTQGAGWNPGLFDTSGLPSGTLTFGAFGTAVITLTVSWPAAAYDRYIELTVANAKLAEETKSPRFRVSATPDGDSMTLSAILSGGNSAPATTITANLFQASGVDRAVTAMFYAQQINTHVAVF